MPSLLPEIDLKYEILKNDETFQEDYETRLFGKEDGHGQAIQSTRLWLVESLIRGSKNLVVCGKYIIPDFHFQMKHKII